jgi:hypothetical protein
MTAPPAIMGVALGDQETLEPNPSRARENKMATDTLGKGHEVLIPEEFRKIASMLPGFPKKCSNSASPL